MIRFLFHLLVAVLLTIITQIGAIAWFLALLLKPLLGKAHWFKTLGIFLITYSLVSFGAALIAPKYGRVSLPCFSGNNNLAMHSLLYCSLNRHYVTPKTRAFLTALADNMEKAHPGTKTAVLDANFPFFNGFPLIPHLSHSDGRKADLAFYYTDETGKFLPFKTPSPIGYFAFEQPRPGKRRVCKKTSGRLSLRWDLDFLQPFFNWHLKLDEQKMRTILQWLAKKGRGNGLQKAFIEPHLSQRFGITSPLIRFQGCRAARHDDHIHIQTR